MALRADGVVAMTAFVLLGAAACRSAPGTRPLTVAVDIAWRGSACKTSHGWDLQGLEVSVTDESGGVARASLGPAGPPPSGEWVRPASRIRICRFRASVEVPDSDSYSVAVAGAEPLTWSRQDLEQTGWVALVLPPPDVGS